MSNKRSRFYFYSPGHLLLCLIIFLITASIKDIEHQREKSDIKRPYRPPRYELVPVTPPTEGGGQEHDPSLPSEPLPHLSLPEYPQNFMPPEYLPHQGMLPRIEKKNQVMQQDEGNFMSHPMPQRNPGPSAVFPARPRHRIPD